MEKNPEKIKENIEEEKEKKEENEEIMKFIFDGVFNTLEAVNLFFKHLSFIQAMDKKRQKKFIISKKEIEEIIIINKDVWEVMECNVESVFPLENKSRYEISVKLKNKFNNGVFKSKKSLMKNPYKFDYEKQDCTCYMLESLRDYFSKIRKENDFYIVVNDNGKEVNLQPSSFFSMDFNHFQIKKNYKYDDIELEKIDIKNIYKISEIIKGFELNQKLGLYTNLKEDDFTNFIFYETNEREKLINTLARLTGKNNNIGLCGPFGTGKTITLLRFLIESDSNRIFYINLWTIDHTSLTHLKNLFKYESIKLFGGNIFNKNEKFCLEEDLYIYGKIINEINNFNNKKEIISLLEKIINLMNKIKCEENIYIIIDQYSSKYDSENKSLNHLLDIDKNSNIYIIVSSSMNNYDIKNNFSDSLNLELMVSKESFQNNLRFNYYYIGCLFRLDQLKNYNELIEKESSEFKINLNAFGNLPLFYYKLKERLKWKGKLNGYMTEEKNEIIEEFDLYYEKNSEKNFTSKFLNILTILSIINGKEIYFVDELSNQILNLPLKFFEIKKEEIKLGDLKVFAFASKNQSLIDKLKNIEKDNKILEKLLANDRYTKDLTQFINKDNFCSKYIKHISNKKKKKIIGENSDKMKNKIIIIYYLDYLFPYMEEILLEMIYNLLINTTKYIFENIPAQSQGGVLEYIIYEFVKNHELFMDINVLNYETIECLVPNNFFIQNYSSRKTETLKTYIENKKSPIKKGNLPKKHIFINQSQFTGKYYDCGLLIYKALYGTYTLYLFQISKRKIESNRYYREEHKIIFNRVKENLEEIYSIKIDKGYFAYILVYEDQDKNTIDFCEKNSLRYYLFSIKNLKFSSDELFFDDISLITEEFPIHSSFSILPKKNFEKDNKGNLKNIEDIIKLEKKLKFETISKELKGFISQYFIPKNSEINSKNDFLVAGSFEEMFDVNHNFCIWIDNYNSTLKYTNKNKKVIEHKINNFTKLSDLKYTLLCSKYKIECYYKN